MEQAIDDEIGVLIAACQRCPAHVVLVTNEGGDGHCTGEPPGAAFSRYCRAGQSAPGWLADAVWLVVSGIGVKIK
ncbi:bifunctional adenosylcobinamide kinase/adenosylcobinamide-phosphate guanylyltransferase [Klebsiella pneumoniae]